MITRTLTRVRETRNAVLYEELHENCGVRNLYLRKDLVLQLGNPEFITVTVEGADDDG